MGRVGIAERDCVLTPQTTYYRTSPEVFANSFLMVYLASPFFSEQVDVVKEQTTRDFVPISEQYHLYHRVPPLEEQHEIVRRVQTLFKLADTIEKRVGAATRRTDKLTQAILAKAFRGELVPTEAELARREGRTYEPASVLLERIKAEREKVEKASASKNDSGTLVRCSMKFIEDDWREEVRKKFSNSVKWEHQWMYRVCFQENLAWLRDEIEGWLIDYPPGPAQKLIEKLRNPRSHTQTYHEIAVGAHLRSCGFDLGYDQKIQNLTPDFSVYLAGQLVFIVEVFTVNLSDEFLSYLTQKEDLLTRIRSVPKPVRLTIRVDLRTAKLEPGTNKRIKAKLEKWLGNTDSRSVTIEGVNFEIIGNRVEGSSVDPCIVYSIGGKSFFCTDRLEKIKEKESRYKNLGIPLVVAIVPDMLAGLSKATMDDVLIGQEAVLEDLRLVREDDSLFKKLKFLTAVLFLWRPSDKWTSTLYVNPFVGVSSDVLRLQETCTI